MAGRQIVGDDLFQRLPSLSQSSEIIKDSSSPRGIIVYIEFKSLCPFVGIGSPHSLPGKCVAIPPGPKWGGETHVLAGGRGWGDPIPTKVHKLWYSFYVFYNPFTLLFRRKFLYLSRHMTSTCVVTVLEIDMIMRLWSMQKIFSFLIAIILTILSVLKAQHSTVS